MDQGIPTSRLHSEFDVDACTILRVVVGSQAYGISSGENSDRDEKGVCIEPFAKAVGLSGFEQFEYRSAAERTGQKDAPSLAGDLDLTIYSLKKFLKLALKGNPTIIEMFFIKNYVSWNALGTQLQELYPLIVSKRAGGAYLGYMQAQKRKLMEKESKEGTERAELVAKFGYDTKYAGHLLRLGMQGFELLATGRLTLPLNQDDAQFIRDVRAGVYPLAEVLRRADNFEAMLKLCMDSKEGVRPEPDYKAVEQWMVERYWYYWSAQRRMLDLSSDSVIQ